MMSPHDSDEGYILLSASKHMASKINKPATASPNETPACDMYRVAISPETRSKSKTKPPTASSDGGESHRWRTISERPRDAAIVLLEEAGHLLVHDLHREVEEVDDDLRRGLVLLAVFRFILGAFGLHWWLSVPLLGLCWGGR
mmetsp:Transcript_8471/g.22870  ORF Transcript_8471/g.22870 Transcript_8471/m.22870 type:complete len:143 (+) Transcript_8471:1008-1436(+)